jgi:hypothetical protein
MLNFVYFLLLTQYMLKNGNNWQKLATFVARKNK